MNAIFHQQPGSSSLRRVWLAIALIMALLVVATSPAVAHKDHKKKPPEAAQVVKSPSTPGALAAINNDPAAMHSKMGEMMEGMEKDRSKMSTGVRLLDWLGRLHPMIVHFPIAFFPTALFTAIVGRRRPAFAKPVQFMVVAGGILAPIAAILGWFDAGFDFATDDALLQPHRWLGTAIGIGALGLAIWAMRRPEADRSSGMIVGLTVMTAAIVIQGWFGGALVHGMDHMNW